MWVSFPFLSQFYNTFPTGTPRRPVDGSSFLVLLFLLPLPGSPALMFLVFRFLGSKAAFLGHL